MTFSDLLKPDLSMLPGDQQRRASDLFPSVVSQSSLELWKPGDPIPSRGRRLLIGVAPSYSRYDLALLDEVDVAIRRKSGHGVVQVFDVAKLPTQDSFEAYVPGIGEVQGTPVAGLWEDGQLVRIEKGAAARRLIQECLDK